MKNELVSIIVPIYNVEKYLPDCVESILKQTYPVLEILLIDDGSTDDSGAICDDYASKHENIIVYHKKNGGLSSARNYGIERANGNKLVFVDSDDFIEVNMVDVLMKDMYRYDADLCCCNNCKVFEDGRKMYSQPKYLQKTVLCNSDVLYGIYDDFSAWNKLYKKTLFDRIRFPEGMLYEDARTTYRIATECSVVVYNPEPLYYYRQRSSSIMGEFSTKNYMDRVNVWNEIYNFVEDKFTTEQLREVKMRKNKLVIELIASIWAKRKVLKNYTLIKKLRKEIYYDCINFKKYSLREILMAYCVRGFI